MFVLVANVREIFGSHVRYDFWFKSCLCLCETLRVNPKYRPSLGSEQPLDNGVSGGGNLYK